MKIEKLRIMDSEKLCVELELVEPEYFIKGSVDTCGKCFYNPNSCPTNCGSRSYWRLKPQWIQCTKENVQVGDTVHTTCDITKTRKVVYVGDERMVLLFDGEEGFCRFQYYSKLV